MKTEKQTQVIIYDKLENINYFVFEIFIEEIKTDLKTKKLYLENNNLILNLDSLTYETYLKALNKFTGNYINYNRNFYQNILIESKKYFNCNFEQLIFRFKKVRIAEEANKK